MSNDTVSSLQAFLTATIHLVFKTFSVQCTWSTIIKKLTTHMQTFKKSLALLVPATLLFGACIASAATSTSTETSMMNPPPQNMTDATNTLMLDTTNSASSTIGMGTSSDFGAYLFGNDEVPGVPDMTEGLIMLNRAVSGSSTGMRYDLAVQNGLGITAAHLHCAESGRSGPAIVTLYMSMGTDVNGMLASGMISDSDILPSAKGCSETIGYEINDIEDLTRAINDGVVYANIHSMNYPDGVARGQILGGTSTDTTDSADTSSPQDPSMTSDMPSFSTDTASDVTDETDSASTDNTSDTSANDSTDTESSDDTTTDMNSSDDASSTDSSTVMSE